MKKNLAHSIALTALVASAFSTGSVIAADTLAFNAGVVTDYRYRGISQSRLKPALQAGFDYTMGSGFYVGAWGSSIKWIKDAGATDGSLEVDVYGGYKASMGGIAYDVGLLRYEYVGNKLGQLKGFANANTTEIYGALTYGVFTAKYSNALTNTFGNANSKNSGYLDLSATFDLGNGLTLTPHAGRQVIKNSPAFSYTDYSLTLGKDLGSGLSVSLMAVSTNANKSSYTVMNKYLGKDALVAGIKYTF
jgi:uncharacterized protein (TIGR02001 family)